jgi:hypothetical protein
MLYNTGGSIKSRVIKDGEHQKIVKAISTGQPKERIAKVAYNSVLKEELGKCVIKDIDRELVSLISKKNGSCLRISKRDNLTRFKFETLLFEIQLYAPVLYKTLSHTLKDSPIGIAVTTAIIANHRNMHMSAFHHIAAQILDHCGVTDEVKKNMNTYFRLISPYFVHN